MNKLPELKAAIFDLDGTLLDSMHIWDTFGEEYLKSIGVAPREGVNRAVGNLSIVQAAQYFREEYGVPFSEEEIMDGINRLAEKCYREEAPLKKGVREFLAKLHAQGVKMCVATATDRYLVDAALTRCGVRQYFSEIFTCTEVGSGKDEPVIFRRALAFLGENRQNTVFFEDALYAVKTAKADGFFVCAVYDPHERNASALRALADMYVMGMDEPENNAG